MTKMKKTYALIAMIFWGLGGITVYALLANRAVEPHDSDLSQRINLALRRTAHLLLRQSGDSTSTIAPIRQTDAQTYHVDLKKRFNYDSLPRFLQNSLAVFNIKNGYNVMVWRDTPDTLLLGYTHFDVANYLKTDTVNATIPCLGRDLAATNLSFSVRFDTLSPKESLRTVIRTAAPLTGILGFIGAMAALFLWFLTTRGNNEKWAVQSLKTRILVEKTTISTLKTDVIPIGTSFFDLKNQTFTTNGIEQTMTFQEAQLFHLFCQHPNELLDRETILKTVWDDEGVLITRSVDVFISRLRKIIKQDAALKITNIHGRGYRLDVQATA
jgi:DNA-binding winged helix-turn-helix (wHTH) protein